MRCKGVSGFLGGREVKEWDGCKWWCCAVGAKPPSRLYGVTGGWELRLRVGIVLLALLPLGWGDEDRCMSCMELARSSGWALREGSWEDSVERENMSLP